jgi:hypothetical protein
MSKSSKHTVDKALKYALCRFLHENGAAFILFVWGDESDG